MEAILTDVVRLGGGGCGWGASSVFGIDWLRLSVKYPRNTREEQIHAPRRVQNQVNESFGFEVSLDAVVLLMFGINAGRDIE